MTRAPAHREDQPRARRRAAATGRQARACDRLPAGGARRPRPARAVGQSPGRRASPRTRSSGAHSSRWRSRRGSSRSWRVAPDQADPGRRRSRRRQLGRGHRPSPRQRDVAGPARTRAAARARRDARSGRPVLPRSTARSSASGDGTELTPLDLPQDFSVLLLVPDGAAKESTAAVYRAFDQRDGAAGFEDRRRALLDALAASSARGPGRAASQRPRLVRSQRPSSRRSGRFAPTSAAPARPSTGSSSTRSGARKAAQALRRRADVRDDRLLVRLRDGHERPRDRARREPRRARLRRNR